MDNDRFNRIEDKLDEIAKTISAIDKTLEVNTASLQFHIKRTNLLEQKLEPVEDHVKLVNGIVKVLLGLAGLTALVKLFKP